MISKTSVVVRLSKSQRYSKLTKLIHGGNSHNKNYNGIYSSDSTHHLHHNSANYPIRQMTTSTNSGNTSRNSKTNSDNSINDSNQQREKDLLVREMYNFILNDNKSILEIKACEDQKKGRGLFLRSDIHSSLIPNTTLFKEKPFVSYPSIINHENVCGNCLKPLENNKSLDSSVAKNHSKCDSCEEEYCSDKCRHEASLDFHGILCKSNEPGFEKIKKYCTLEKRRFPIMASKILAKILLGIHLEKSIKHTWIPLQMISFAKKPAPLEWEDDYKTFSKELLKSSPSLLKQYNYEWFVRVMQILYLNTIGIDIQREEKPIVSSPASGIGLYFLASFINHSCDPNAYTHFPDDHTCHLKLLKSVQPGDEITISYTDPTQNIVDRRSSLFENYGFNCECPKCVSELPKKKSPLNIKK
ncbi:hypothetical protein CYY_005029 [Polysphondylium violaceum]|uniref:SET domain-containing protein n=1 Tax=Polysphondylium violaceum TaxID=133409 RepID=A0A8J4V783_9MYCE|nr:hypothetical protein CYY_005029 [Polysphondylium violaceum]